MISRCASPFPRGRELAERLPGLQGAIYLLFTGGYTAGEGERLMHHELCAEALRLATLLTAHPATATGETHALAALMCFHHARAAARTGETGDLVVLAEQDRTLWDRELLARGFVHLKNAMAAPRLTALHLEAGIAAVHAAAPSFDETDWEGLCRHYDALIELKDTPVVRLNAAIARAYAEGAAAGLAQLDALAGQVKLGGYAPYHAARGDLLLKLQAPRGSHGRAHPGPRLPAERCRARLSHTPARECSPPTRSASTDSGRPLDDTPSHVAPRNGVKPTRLARRDAVSTAQLTCAKLPLSHPFP